MAEQITSMLQLHKDRRASRFTLLFLEYNEFLLNDLAVYKYDAPTPELSWVRSMDSRVGGRLKLCTRGLVFEPTSDPRAPIVRFPFKAMTLPLSPFPLSPGSAAATAVDPATLFAFTSKLCIDVESGGRVAPFVTHEFKPHPRSFVFQLQHSTVAEFLLLACELQRIEGQRSAFTDPRGLLRPIVANRMAGGSGILHAAGGINSAPSSFAAVAAEDSAPCAFELRHLVDFGEKLLMASPVRVDRLRPLLRNPGVLMVTDREVYFQPSEVNNTGEQTEHWPLRRLRQLVARRHMLRHTGLELSTGLHDGGGSSSSSSTAFFNFESPKDRDQVLSLLRAQPGVAKQCDKSGDLRSALQSWQNGELSNFEYLAFLNACAGRSVHDLTQYPVFPWVLQDYESAKLDLEDPETFRDLSKPIGALDPTRLAYFKERFVEMPPEDKELGMPPPFLYGSHYSTPGFVLYYLVRAAPQHMLSLQSGKFDAPDRMFHSVSETWGSVLRNAADVKELTPEFYSGDGSFLVNEQQLPLGVTQDGEQLHHVKLPPWAKSPRDFVRKCRKALDSEHVSAHLHEWVDLVFGFKQRGAEAVEADNVFYYLTYEGAVDLEAVSDPNKRAAYESQINEFGQCPSQLFKSKHPSRFTTNGDGKKQPNLAAAASLWLASEPNPPGASTAVDRYARAYDTARDNNGEHGGGSGGGTMSTTAAASVQPPQHDSLRVATDAAATAAAGVERDTRTASCPVGSVTAENGVRDSSHNHGSEGVRRGGSTEEGGGGGATAASSSSTSSSLFNFNIGGRVSGFIDRVKSRTDSSDSAENKSVSSGLGGLTSATFGFGGSGSSGGGGSGGDARRSSGSPETGSGNDGGGDGGLLSKPAPPPSKIYTSLTASRAAAFVSTSPKPSPPPTTTNRNSNSGSTYHHQLSTGSFAKASQASVEKERGAPLPPPPNSFDGDDHELASIIDEFARLPAATTAPAAPAAAATAAPVAAAAAAAPAPLKSNNVDNSLAAPADSQTNPQQQQQQHHQQQQQQQEPSSPSASESQVLPSRDRASSGGRVSEASSSGTTDDEDDEGGGGEVRTSTDGRVDAVATSSVPPSSAPAATATTADQVEEEEEEDLGKLKVVSCQGLSAAVRNHRDAITSVALLVSSSSSSSSGDEEDSGPFLCASTSRDGSLRVTPLASFPSLSPSSPTLASDLPSSASSSLALSRRRLFQAGDLALSCCSLVGAGKGDVGVVCGSWDNSLLYYSVNSACLLGPRVADAHDDSVSCVDAGLAAIDGGQGQGLVVSGSWDASVKVWRLKRGRARGSSLRTPPTAPPSGLRREPQLESFVGLDPTPLLELFDHEEQVQCVRLDPLQGRLVASGADDGRVVVSDISRATAAGAGLTDAGLSGGADSSSSVEPLVVVELSELQAAGGGGGCCGVTAVAWGGGSGVGGGGGPRLFVCSKDRFVRELSVGAGLGACLAAVPFGAEGVPLSLAASHSLVVCAGEGGSLRVWAWGGGGRANRIPALLDSKERVHEGESGILSVGLEGRLLITASETALRMWSLVPE